MKQASTKSPVPSLLMRAKKTPILSKGANLRLLCTIAAFYCQHQT